MVVEKLDAPALAIIDDQRDAQAGEARAIADAQGGEHMIGVKGTAVVAIVTPDVQAEICSIDWSRIVREQSRDQAERCGVFTADAEINAVCSTPYPLATAVDHDRTVARRAPDDDARDCHGMLSANSAGCSVVTP